MIDIAIIFHDAVVGLLWFAETDVQHIRFAVVVRPHLVAWKSQQTTDQLA